MSVNIGLVPETRRARMTSGFSLFGTTMRLDSIGYASEALDLQTSNTLTSLQFWEYDLIRSTHGKNCDALQI